MFIKLCKINKAAFSSVKICKSTQWKQKWLDHSEQVFWYLFVQKQYEKSFPFFGHNWSGIPIKLRQNTVTVHKTLNFVQCSNFPNNYSLNCKLNFCVSVRLIFQKCFFDKRFIECFLCAKHYAKQLLRVISSILTPMR